MSVLAGSDAFEVCAETDDGPTARRLFERHRPRVAIVGPTLRGGEGLQLIKEFRKMDKKAAILMLSAAEDAMSIYRAWRAGALGYLRVFDARSELIAALEKICAGDRYVSKGLEQLVLNMFANGAANSTRSKMDKLSDREREIFLHIGKGTGISEIARLLHVSPKTVETYRGRVRDKLRLRDAVDLRQTSARWANKSDWKCLEGSHVWSAAVHRIANASPLCRS